MRTARSLLLTTLALVALLALPTHAEVIFSSYPYSTGGGWGVVGPLEPFQLTECDLACDFHIPSGTSYRSIVVRLATDNVWGTHQMDVMLMSDTLVGSPRPTPGSVLATQQIVTPEDPESVTIPFPAELLLQAGKSYWVALSTPGDGFQSWRWAIGLTADYRAYKSRSGSWVSENGQFCGFVVEGTPATTDAPDAGADRRGPLALTSRPNPFISCSTLSYALDREAEVTLSLHDLSGRTVRMLMAGTRQAPGAHQIVWDGCTAAGAKAAPGVYFAILRAGDLGATRRLARIE